MKTHEPTVSELIDVHGVRPLRHYIPRVRKMAERVELYLRQSREWARVGDTARAERWARFAEIHAGQALSNVQWAYRHNRNGGRA